MTNDQKHPHTSAQYKISRAGRQAGEGVIGALTCESVGPSLSRHTALPARATQGCVAFSSKRQAARGSKRSARMVKVLFSLLFACCDPPQPVVLVQS